MSRVPVIACFVSFIAPATELGAAPGPRLFAGDRGPPPIGAAAAGLDGTGAAICASCHADIAAEWAESLHARSWRDPVFQAAYEAEPRPYCRSCHAPLAGGEEPRGAAADEGISCAVCHVRHETVLAGPEARRGAAPHPVDPRPELADSRFCAPCHEFGFFAPGPGGRSVETRELQQATFSEWRARERAGQVDATCQDCHMPWRPNRLDGTSGRHRSHRFPGGRDAGFVARALDVTVSARRAGGRVALTASITAPRAGHAVPTGDQLRRLELTAWPDGAPAAGQTLVYARTFATRAGPRGIGRFKVEVADTRVGEGPTERTLIFARPAAGILRWRLDYLLMPRDLAAAHGVPPSANVTPLARGTLGAL